MTGVSTDIGTSFLKPGGGEGDIITGKAAVSAIGVFFSTCDPKVLLRDI
jgi:hypothetical protein